MNLPDADNGMEEHRLEDNWLDARVEPYLDKELPPAERRRFEEHLADRPDWQRELRRARAIRDGLHDLSVPPCPPRVTQAVRSRTRRASDRPPRRTTHRSMGWRPVLAAALLFLIVTVAPLISPPPEASEHSRYTRAEIRQAAAEVQWTLAYVAGVMDETQQTVRHDVLEDHVVEPVQEAFADFILPTNSSTDS